MGADRGGGHRSAGHIRLGSIDPQTQGEFFINRLKEPQIVVYRNRRADTVDDYEQELITLAHEYGHAQSHLKGQRPWQAMPKPSAKLTLRRSAPCSRKR